MVVLRQEVLDQLVADTSADLLPLLLQSFLDELAQRHQELSNALTNSEAAPIREAAHSLKSCSGTYGAEQLWHAAMALENAAAENQQPLIPDLANAVHAAVTETQRVYADHLANLN